MTLMAPFHTDHGKKQGRHGKSAGWSLMFTMGLPESSTVWSGRDKAGERQNSQHSTISVFIRFVEVGGHDPQSKYGNESRSGRLSVVKKIQSDQRKHISGGGWVVAVWQPGRCRKDSSRKQAELRCEWCRRRTRFRADVGECHSKQERYQVQCPEDKEQAQRCLSHRRRA